jgi:putative PIN family toxin of toxin-antitoxin system
MNRPSAVLDTNVLVAGLRSRLGASHRLLELLAQEQLLIHVSVPLVLEYEAVLLRQAKALGLSQKDVEDFVGYLCRVGEAHDIHFMWRPMLKDPNDDMVLELAFASGAGVVTFNGKDFKEAGQLGVKIWTPGAFLRALEVQS